MSIALDVRGGRIVADNPVPGREFDSDRNTIAELEHAAWLDRYMLAGRQLMAVLTTWTDEHSSVGGLKVSCYHLPSFRRYFHMSPADVTAGVVQAH